ncbi:MAG: hypothetical protein Q8868_04130 [Bacteroidota bacterium]|nr:hypothetical protein [Bacteroidota bacterium]
MEEERMIRGTSPAFGLMIMYFIPLISSLCGIADNEQFTLSMLVSVALILIVVYIINRAGLRKAIKI